MREIAIEILNLRIIVLSLGEISTPPWWQSKFLNETGIRFLNRLFPRSSFFAAINSSAKAAMNVHDKAIGRTGVYHLFRLPDVLENEIREIFKNNPELNPELILKLGKGDELKNYLRQVSINGTKREWIGPQKIGNFEDCMNIESYKIIASAYLNAFENNRQVFPYFDIQRRDE